MKKSVKKSIIAVSVALLALSANPANATGIPVFDGAAAAQDALQLVQMIEQVANSVTQINNQVEQIKQLKAQVESLTGSRDMGALAEGIKSAIPDEWKDIYGNLENINFEEVINSKSYKPETRLKLMVDNLNQAEKAITETKQSFEQLDVLLKEIDKTKDMKASADLQNRISIEQARIANNQTKLDMIQNMYALNERIEMEKQKKYAACLWENHGDKSKCE